MPDIIKKALMMVNREVPTEKLIKKGLKVGNNFNRQQGCFIDPSHCFLIEIGDNVTMSIRVTLMAHDAGTKKGLGYTRIGRIRIGNNVFLGANSTVLPNVRIGDNAIIGAGSVVTRDIPANCVAAGVPAKILCSAEEYLAKNRALIGSSKTFDASYRMGGGLNEEKKAEMLKATETGIAFIE